MADVPDRVHVPMREISIYKLHDQQSLYEIVWCVVSDEDLGELAEGSRDLRLGS